MNTAQKSKYWCTWGNVCRANQWRMTKGRLSSKAVRDGGLAGHHTAVWYAAESLAAQHCRAVTADDLRHACHVYAFGRDISHSDLSNAQFDRLLLLWGNERDTKGLLIDSDDIAAQTAWDHPDQARKESLIGSIEDAAMEITGAAAAGEAYIRAITGDLWGTIMWRDLESGRLLSLLRKLKGNLAKAEKAPSPF